MGFWAKSLRIFNAFCDNATQSIRQVAQSRGFPRAAYIVSNRRWNAEMATQSRGCGKLKKGTRWLLASGGGDPLYLRPQARCGRRNASASFSAVCVWSRRSAVPRAPYEGDGVVEQAILETTAAWEHEGIAAGRDRDRSSVRWTKPSWQRMMLVFMDLASGYLLFEEVAEDRSYDTWHALVKARLETLGVRVLYLVSDRAKALIKLAETGLECLSVPDLFHLLHDLVKGYALAICSRLRQAQQALQQAQERLATCQTSHPDGPEVQQAQAVVEAQ